MMMTNYIMLTVHNTIPRAHDGVIFSSHTLDYTKNTMKRAGEEISEISQYSSQHHLHAPWAFLATRWTHLANSQSLKMEKFCKCYPSLEVERINFSEGCGSSHCGVDHVRLPFGAAEHHASVVAVDRDVLILTHREGRSYAPSRVNKIR